MKNKCFERGFVFSLEATIALMLFVLMLLALPIQQNTSLKELLILQQENDLLRIWSTKETPTNEMVSDIKLMFGENGEVWVNNVSLNKAIIKNNSISSEGIILDGALRENLVRVVVNYD